MKIKLTQYSHGAGCGCKIAPEVLDSILSRAGAGEIFPGLLVGNTEKDDAAVMDLGDGTGIISTTDFFMPIVDDPYTFGQIASANAISDVYAMGGTPMMAIAILGWPINVLPGEEAGEVIRGAKNICERAGIPLAGGHSIDSPEPIFGLAVTGRVKLTDLKKNGGAREGDLLFLTKPLGIGILSTAQKKGQLQESHEARNIAVMTLLNNVGEELGQIADVHAMTDVTGFGLAGHLIEMCEASQVSGEICFDKLPLIDDFVKEYLEAGCIPGGTHRNFSSYGCKLELQTEEQKIIVCDPQTSGGLLIAVSPESEFRIRELLSSHGLHSEPVGRIVSECEKRVIVVEEAINVKIRV